MKILVIGAGVLGSYYAARLQQGGHDVSILARGQRLLELQTHGIVLQAVGDNKQQIVPIRSIGQMDVKDLFELIVVVVRAQQIPSVLELLKSNESEAPVLFLTNNAAGPTAFIDALGSARVIMGYPNAGGTKVGQVVHYYAPRWLERIQPITIGTSLDGSLTHPKNIVNTFKKAGLNMTISSDMDAWLKAHAAFVVPFILSLQAEGNDPKSLAGNQAAMARMIRAIREYLRVLRAAKVSLSPKGFLYVAFEKMPESWLAVLLKQVLKSPNASFTTTNAEAEFGETQSLLEGMSLLTRTTSVTTPNVDELRRLTKT